MGIVNRVLELLFPTRESAARVAALSPTVCNAEYAPRYFGDILALAPYSDADVRACITECKFHTNDDATSLLASYLSRWLADAEVPYDAVIPLPLHRARFRKRGYNQVTRILKATSLPSQTAIVHNCLIRTRNTKPQTQLSKKERRQNLTGAFALTRRAEQRLAGKRVLLVDDVVTTGTTIREARRALAAAKPTSITCVAIAGARQKHS